MTASSASVATPAAPATPAPFPDPARFDDAYARVRGDSSIQFDLPIREVEPPQFPEWLLRLLRGVGEFVGWAGPVWSWLFWVILAILVALVIWLTVPSLRERLIGLLRRRPKPASPPPAWTPTADEARRLLGDADALAAEGRFDEAVRLLLHRSIEDIQRWRGELVRPSFTSRDIVALRALPGEAQPVFARIVAAVERSLFAGRNLGAADWERARGDYARFALKGA